MQIQKEKEEKEKQMQMKKELMNNMTISINSFSNHTKGWIISHYGGREKNFTKDSIIKANLVGIIGPNHKKSNLLISLLENQKIQESIDNINKIKIRQSETFNKKVFYYTHCHSFNPILYDTNKNSQQDYESSYNDKQIKNRFILNLILKRANIIVIIIKKLTFETQHYINTIRSKIDKRIIVIHDLKDNQDHNSYINNTIKKALCKISELNIESVKCYEEECFDSKMKNNKITHLITNLKSEPKFMIEYIKKLIIEEEHKLIDFSPINDIISYFRQISKLIYVEPVDNIVDFVDVDNKQIIEHVIPNKNVLRKNLDKNLEILDHYLTNEFDHKITSLTCLDPRFEDDDPTKYYDIILQIDSLSRLKNGWKMKYNDQGYRRYNQMKDKISMVLGVVGQGNKGKSHILQRLSGLIFPTGFSIKTEGLSVKYPANINKNIILLDTAGQETPLIIDENLTDLTNELIARDRHLTELFLQEFVITHANILLIVVGQLTFSEQKFLNRIKHEYKGTIQKLFVIHNLQTFVEVSQVKKYIQEVLMKSITFQLEKSQITQLKNEINNEDKHNNKDIYMENFMDNQNNQTNVPKIIHMIMANEYSEAGSYYNESTINYLIKQCETFTSATSFNILEKIKDHLYSRSNKLFEEPMTKKEDIIINDTSLTLSDPKKITLSHCYVDELGYSTFVSNNFTPKYSCHIKDGQFIIELEGCCCSNIFLGANKAEDHYIFKITGKKGTGDNNSLVNTRESGDFAIEIKIPYKKIMLTSLQNPTFEKNNGLKIWKYDLVNNNEETAKSYD